MTEPSLCSELPRQQSSKRDDPESFFHIFCGKALATTVQRVKKTRQIPAFFARTSKSTSKYKRSKSRCASFHVAGRHSPAKKPIPTFHSKIWKPTWINLSPRKVLSSVFWPRKIGEIKKNLLARADLSCNVAALTCSHVLGLNVFAASAVNRSTKARCGQCCLKYVVIVVAWLLRFCICQRCTVVRKSFFGEI